MSLYYLQKFLYQLNRDPAVQRRFREDLEGLLGEYDMTEDERSAIRSRDVGLLYVFGVNGQILMHYAAMLGWNGMNISRRCGRASAATARCARALMR
jgi:hypothetical protein